MDVRAIEEIDSKTTSSESLVVALNEAARAEVSSSPGRSDWVLNELSIAKTS